MNRCQSDLEVVEVLRGVRNRAESFAATAMETLVLQIRQIPFDVDREHSIAWRIKSDQAIVRKVESKRRINDFIGIRILALHLGAVDHLNSIILHWADTLELSRVEDKDRFSETNESGYKAIHLDFQFKNDNRWDMPLVAGIEVQITTWLQHFHNQLSHKLFYKRNSSQSLSILPLLKEFSDKCAELDAEILVLISNVSPAP